MDQGANFAALHEWAVDVPLEPMRRQALCRKRRRAVGCVPGASCDACHA